MAAVLWIVALAMAGLTIIDPRTMWYSTSAWQFKHPEANEPSEASFVLGRVMTGLMAVGFGSAAIIATASAVAPLSQERLDTAGFRAATELDGSYFKYASPGVSEITSALRRDDVMVREGRTVTDDNAPFGEPEATEEYYEIVGIEDDSITGCMEISYLGGLFHEGDIDVTASYEPGRC